MRLDVGLVVFIGVAVVVISKLFVKRNLLFFEDYFLRKKVKVADLI
jgi:hypothetical protein